jgi:predicted Rossmann fold nucleotide-binding protein DprA/Smf involved in DNA uptake
MKMISKRVCAICDRERLCEDNAVIDGVCAECLREFAQRIERFQQQIAAADANLSVAAWRVFDAMVSLSDKNGDKPMTLDGIAEEAGRTKTAVRLQILKLQEAGLVEREDGLSRTLRLARNPGKAEMYEST